MQRDILRIDEELCDGCGNCVTSCAEGALELIDGKARVVREDFCDGFGDCVGACPTGALTIEKRSAVAFDKEAVKAHLFKTRGEEAVRTMEEAHQRHEQTHHSTPLPSGIPHAHAAAPSCPGSRARVIDRNPERADQPLAGSHAIPSELGQWPVQLHLVQPEAPFFKNKELVVLSTCGPVASADIHWRFLRGRSVVVACPKLDNTAPYVEKLAEILRKPSIPKVQLVIMRVPCCKGLSRIVEQAAQISGRKDLEIQENVIGFEGGLLETKTLNV